MKKMLILFAAAFALESEALQKLSDDQLSGVCGTPKRQNYDSIKALLPPEMPKAWCQLSEAEKKNYDSNVAVRDSIDMLCGHPEWVETAHKYPDWDKVSMESHGPCSVL